MKLKTLKDLTNNSRDSFDCNAYLIKAEAIKWVKDFEKNRNLIRGLNSRSGIEIVFMDFFNITEEDLE